MVNLKFEWNKVVSHIPRRSIKFKIFLVSLLPTIALIAAAFLNHQYLTILGESAEQILSKNYKSIKAGQESRKLLEEIRNLFLAPVNRKERLADIPPGLVKKISDALDICRDNITEKGELELIDRLLESYSQYKKAASLLDKRKSKVWNEQEIFDIFAITAEMILTIDELVSVNEQAMERAEIETRTLAGEAQRNAVIFFGIIIVTLSSLNYFFSHRIVMPIIKLADQLSKIKEGSGDYPDMAIKADDEIGVLAGAFNQLFQRISHYDNHRDNIIAAEKEKVRQSEEAKVRFIADISHQLKTPMTSLSMSLGLLHSRGEKLIPEKQKKLYDTAFDDCSRLATLINELVDVSRLETMSQPRPKETLNIKMVITESVAPLVKQAEKKGISIHLDIPDSLPDVTIDSFRFPWVITNLIGNALRYTSKGAIILFRAYRQGQRCYFQCSDTGEGIKPEYLPHIFDRFTQFSERGKSGTVGLGLAIVKDIIDQHGGDIKVKSRVGEGTVFTFWIPGSIKENTDE
ncbi:MAG: HAMP domain-containing histidine kinase [Desulfobacter sp.]|nr:HAMP domain-containing histidine kinase [Desulfobacter sp.]